MNYNLLTNNDKKIIQPQSITKQLMNHQKTMVQRMIEIEENGCINLDILNTYNNYDKIKGSALIETNTAILGDKVGAGKTLMIITLISIKPKTISRMLNLGGASGYTIKINLECINLKSNLILVPQKLVPQWKCAFLDSPNLSVYTISLNKHIDNIKKEYYNNGLDEIRVEEIDKNKVDNYDVILIGDTMFKRFYKCSKNYKFNRIFIDEADTIKLPRDLTLNCNFSWLVTGTPSGLWYRSIYFIKKMFSSDCHGINKYFVIKNDDKYIDQSITLPSPKRFSIKCLTPKELYIIKDLIPPAVLQMINAGNSEQAIKALNCNVDTNENILQVITKNITENIENKKIELEAECKKKYRDLTKEQHDAKIKVIENQLNKYISKYEDIKKKIYQLNEDFCPVCMGDYTNPVIVACCNNTFCFDCLAVSLGELKNNKCPYCRQRISKEDIHLFSSNLEVNNYKKSNKNIKYDIKDKLDVLTEIILKKKDGSFMIFANYSETFTKIEVKLKELNIGYHILKGQSSIVNNYIEDFKNKKVNVLMLNAQYFGAGMNLQSTTDIIMYHRFNVEMEEQIIGRAQRLGRSKDQQLNVYYLLHDNESDLIENKFNFEEVNDIHYTDYLDNYKNNVDEVNNLKDEEIINFKGKKIIIDDDLELNNFEILS